MSRTSRQWWMELTAEARTWSWRHPVEQLRHIAYVNRLRRTAAQSDALASQVLDSLDHDAFVDRFRAHWDPFPTKEAPKYLHLGYFMRDSATHCVALGLFDDGKPKRILDVGCGPGYFLTLCRSLGHDALGIDLGDVPLYNELIDFQGLSRIVHTVSAASPLPALDGQFDIVSAFGVTFNFSPGPTGWSWSADEWARAIEGFVGVLAPGGKVVIHFNQDPRTGALYPSGLRRHLARRPDIDSRFFGEYLIVERTAKANGVPG